MREISYNASKGIADDKNGQADQLAQSTQELIKGSNKFGDLFKSVDALCRISPLTRYPKVIASTATIRMAKEQFRKLYGKDLAVFPPPGFSCDDSYFAKTVPTTEKPGRLYVGYAQITMRI